MFFGGYPTTKATGYTKSLPAFTKGVAPGYGKFGKPFGKTGKPFGKIGKPFGKFGKPIGFGYPATKAGGYTSKVPVTSVATTPFI